MTRIIFFLFVIYIIIPIPVMAQEPIYLPIIFNNDNASDKRGAHIALGYTVSDIDLIGGSWFKTNGPRTTYQDSEFVPSLSTVKQLIDIGVAVNNSDGWLSGFNEPDTASRYISPKDAAAYWYYIEAVADQEGIKLTSPAMSPVGMPWLWDMVREYRRMFGTSPRFDAVNIHVYDNSPASAQAYILDVRAQMVAWGYGDSELWITELGSYCPDTTTQQTSQFMIEIIDWLEETNYVQRYAWFTNRVPIDSNWSNYKPCELVNHETETITPLGVLYASR